MWGDMSQKRSVFAGCRYRAGDMLQLLILLKAGRYVLPQIFGLALVVRPEVVEVDLPPLQLQVVPAWPHVIDRAILLLETTDQHVLEPLQRKPPELLGLFHYFNFIRRGHNWLVVEARPSYRRHQGSRFVVGSVVEYLLIAEAEEFCFVDHSRKEVEHRLLLVHLVGVEVLDSHVLKRFLPGFVGLQSQLQGLQTFFVLDPVVGTQLFEVVRHRHERFAFCVEGRELSHCRFEFEFLSHLHPVDDLVGEVELLVEFLDDFVFHDAVGPAETPFFAFPGSEGQHMVVLIWVWLPELPQQREPEFFPSVLPVVINYLSEVLFVLHLQQVLMFCFHESHHPTLVAGQVHFLPSLQLHRHDGLRQELTSQHLSALVDEPVLVGLHEGEVDLGQFVVTGQGQVQVGRQTNVVRSHLGKGLDLSHFGHVLDFRDGDVFFLLRCNRFGFFRGDVDDSGFFVGVHLVEFFLGGYELEGF